MLKTAITTAWSAAMKMAGITAGFGLPAALALGAASTAAIIGGVMAARDVGDMISPAGGRTMVSTAEGGLFKLSPNDDLLAGPGIAGGGGGTGALTAETMKTNSRLDALI